MLVVGLARDNSLLVQRLVLVLRYLPGGLVLGTIGQTGRLVGSLGLLVVDGGLVCWQGLLVYQVVVLFQGLAMLLLTVHLTKGHMLLLGLLLLHHDWLLLVWLLLLLVVVLLLLLLLLLEKLLFQGMLLAHLQLLLFFKLLGNLMLIVRLIQLGRWAGGGGLYTRVSNGVMLGCKFLNSSG